MQQTLSGSDADAARHGLIAAFGAYLLWGLFPIYFKVVQIVPPLEVLAHRVIWAVPFGALIIAARRQWGDVLRVLKTARVSFILAVSSLLIAVNWFIYIYAVQQEQVFQASLGYYINPLFNVLVGVLFFQERLRRPQTGAILLAAIGVTVLASRSEQIPWISLALAASFTCYSVIRKQVKVGGMPGLFVETLFLLPIALVYFFWLYDSGGAFFVAGHTSLSLLLTLAGPFTVIPLLLFVLAARRLMLTTIGMIQFIAPTLQFLVGVAYGEVLTVPHLICFVCIWLGIGLFVWDAWAESRKIEALRSTEAQRV